MQHTRSPGTHVTGPVPLDDPIAFLTGTWDTERTMLDRSSGTVGSFTGTTTFTPDGGGLLWTEDGVVRWSSHEGSASRSYRVAGEGTRVVVTFPDGRMLCRLDLDEGHARDEHACSPDTYRVGFTITGADSIDYTWDVTGPAKNMLLTTGLTRRVG